MAVPGCRPGHRVGVLPRAACCAFPTQRIHSVGRSQHCSQWGAFLTLCIHSAVRSFPTLCVPNAVRSQHASPHGSFGAAGCRVVLFSRSFGLQVPAWGCHSTAVPRHRFAQGAQALSAALLCWRSGILMASSCSGLEAWHCGSVRSSRGSCACRAIQQRLQEEHCCESSERVAAAGPASLQ